MAETVHRICNSSQSDDFGRLTRFRVQTCCGRNLSRPHQVTMNPTLVTCGNCIRVMAQWGGRNDRRGTR